MATAKVDSAEIYVFTAAFVDLAARKTFGLLQQPVYSGAATSVVTSAGRAVGHRVRRARASPLSRLPELGRSFRQIVGGARENRFTRGPGFHTGRAGSEAISLEGSTDIGNLVWE